MHIASRESRVTVTPEIEPHGVSIQACSACSGDYEDPELTAWSCADEEEVDEEQSAVKAQRPVARKEFPVRD